MECTRLQRKQPGKETVSAENRKTRETISAAARPLTLNDTHSPVISLGKGATLDAWLLAVAGREPAPANPSRL